MKPLKIVGLVLLLLALSIGSCVGAIFWATHGIVVAADHFVALCSAGKLDEARALGANCPPKLVGAHQPHWSQRSRNNNNGSVAGGVTLRDGSDYPLTMMLIKVGGEWRIVDVGVSDAAPPIPSDAELTKLAQTALIDFADAVAAKDFNAFWQKTAKLWQAQVTAAELQKIFSAFVDAQPPLDAVRKIEPVFEAPPAVDDKGVLRVRGYVPAPRQIGFQLGWVYEHPSWKLMSISVTMKKGE
jgi:hypothetical protein